jgi:hypothetical protein
MDATASRLRHYQLCQGYVQKSTGTEDYPCREETRIEVLQLMAATWNSLNSDYSFYKAGFGVTNLRKNIVPLS